MRKLRYHLVDVFTDRAFGGNPLAVFPHASEVSPKVMQALAKEFNLSETTFVLPPQDEQNTYHVRIFTPAVELPMAGHPTIGTTFILAREHLIDWDGSETTIRLEEGIGTILVTLRRQDDGAEFIQMSQPLPAFGAQFVNKQAMAEMLSLEVDALDPHLPLEVVSCGVPFLFVPVRNIEAMRKIRFRQDVSERVLRDFETANVFVFTREVETVEATVHSRMFAPALGVAEDPATGAASGPLGCYLVQHGLVAQAEKVEIVSEQGIEMGRPSIIHIEIEQEDGRITAVRVGGQCYYMGEGCIELHENHD
jgi:trans-2,3-dihydro-3-hydroxyanthranilate isomerase